jgi:hypothetical protein
MKSHLAIILFIAFAGYVHVAEPPSIKPLQRAHAHNDYAHRRPLLDALDHGFCNVEADVFLVGEKLLVAHDAIDLRPNRTLQALYLDPLRARIKANRGHVYRDGAPGFTLMIDFKTEAETTYRALDKRLADYADILTVVRDGKVESKAVSIVISGNRPLKTIREAKTRYVGLDGRLSDLDSEAPSHLMPWISDNWRNHFQWRGEGPINEVERKKLVSIVKKANARGRKIRFWAAPDNAAAWNLLAASGVDLINTDDLAGLASVLNPLRERADNAEPKSNNE